MDDYISREAVIRHLKGCSEKELNKNSPSGMITSSILNKMERAFSEMPAADVQPVKHGRWETWGYIFHGIAWKRCSVCGKTADVSYQALLDGKIEMATPSICGCCSAIMDGDSE